MPECLVNGLSISYQTSMADPGSETPVVYVHGAGASAHVWFNQLQSEPPGFVHLAPDLPGHARSQGRGAEYVQDYAAWIADFMHTLGYTSCVLVGHSMGGAVAQTLALNSPHLLQALILVGTGAKLRVAEQVLDRTRQGASFAEYAYAPSTPASVIAQAEKEFSLTSPEVRYRDFLACDRFDIMDRVQEIACPALVVCGREDMLTPVKYSQYLHQHLPAARLEVIPQAGHMVMWEQAETFNQILCDFIAGL